MTDVSNAGSVASDARFPGEAHAVLQMAALGDLERSGPLVITEADGLRVRDSDGREYIDALCGLVNVNVGYGRHELADVAAETMRRLSFGTNFFGRTTREALELSEKLAAITPRGIERFFFSVGGSDAMDSAIKLVRHANVLAGKPGKMTVIARRDGYHGMTFGGTTVTGQSILRERVGPLLPGVVHVSQPNPDGGALSAKELEAAILRDGPDTVAAFVGEPISLPPGVAIPPDDYWPAIREVCTRYDVKLIADEVVTGFGRTGRMFACEHWGLEPDVLTMSKGITSGYLPLGAVGIREELFEQLAASDTILPHGFTTGGHPVACAVALANIDIIEREGLVENSAEVGGHVAQRLQELAAAHHSVSGVRSLGLLGAYDLAGEALMGDPADAPRAGVRLTALLMEQGVILRPYGNTMAFALALTATRSDIDDLMERFDSALTELEQEVAGS
jgi:adenosylmethionine-8-amino-7-oxononanoate aminotransferase